MTQFIQENIHRR